MKHCPICNNSSADRRFFGEFCEDCAAKKLRSRIPSVVEMVRCRDCGRIKSAGVFAEESMESLERMLKPSFKPFDVKLVHLSNGIARIRVEDARQEGLEIEHNAHIKLHSLLCDSCARRRAGYYEAVLQFRGEQGKVGRIALALQRYLEKNGAFVTKAERKEHGVDVYASDKKVAMSFIAVRHLKFKASFELHGEKRGKRLYRNTYFITL